MLTVWANQRASLLCGMGGEGRVLHFLSSVHSHFLFPPPTLWPPPPTTTTTTTLCPCLAEGGAFRMLGFVLMLQAGWRRVEPPIALHPADCRRALGAGWGFWVGLGDAG